MLMPDQWGKMGIWAKDKMASYFDPTAIVKEDASLNEIKSDHKGFYIGLVDSSGTDIAREGFLKETTDGALTDILDSAKNVLHSLFDSLKNKNIVKEKVFTSTFHLIEVQDCVYLPGKTTWDENKDGIFFMWGQDHRGLYLPYQIQTMNMGKTQILDRVCAWEAGVASSLWRNPEGLVWKLVCNSHSL